MNLSAPKPHPPCFLALDAGTSSVKAALFDIVGQQLAVHAAAYQLEHPRPDVVELDPDCYWQAAREAIRAVLRHACVAPAAVSALGVTSQGETLIVLDQDGRPLRKAIVWLDNRAVEEARQIAESFDAETVYRLTGQHEIVPCWTAAKILWLRRNEPEVFARAGRYLMVADYLLYKLTGRYVTDHALNPSTLYYDLTRDDWWERMLAFLGIRRDQLPQPVCSGTPVGVVNADVGLPANTKVVTAPIDQIAGAVGAGNLAPGMITETTGSVMAICATCKSPHYDPQRRLGLYRHARPGTYALLPWVPTAGLLYRWFRDTLGGGLDFGELDREAASVAPGAEDLMVLPHLNGAFSPDSNPAARGVFHGISLAHGRAHFVRAILESIAFMLRDQIELLESLDVPVERICALGGGASSDLWLQIKADILQREVVTCETREVTALGVAMLAATGAGAYPTLDEAAVNMVRFNKSFLPQCEHRATYDALFETYRKLNRIILPTFEGTT